MLVFRLLIWNSWNVTHISRHEVTPDEVEEVCHNKPIVQIGKKRRSLIIGPTLSGRMLTIILDPEPSSGEGIYYPVTARPSSRKENALYIKEKGGNNK